MIDDVRIEARPLVYTVFQVLFSKELTAETLELLKDPAVDQAFAAYDMQITRLLDPAKTDEELLADVEHRFNKLFVGPGKVAVSPWRSTYVGHMPLLFQESMLDVRRLYKAAGYECSGYPHVPDDHIATMCGFMASLGAEIAQFDAVDATDVVGEPVDAVGISREFIETCLLDWVPAFAQKALEADCEFYAQAAALLLEFVQKDVDVVRG